MKKLRTILLLCCIAVLSAGVSCSRRPVEYAGMVNDRPITFEEYMIARRNQFESYVLNRGLTPDEAGWKEISDRAFNNLIEGIIFQQQLSRFNITVNRSEVIDTLTTNIPDVILDSHSFREDGRFAMEKYRNSLLNNDPVDLSWLVAYYHDIYVPREKLKSAVLEDYQLLEEELTNEYLVSTSSAEASVIFFPAEFFTDVVIQEREVRDHYSQHRTDFILEPYARIEFVIFPLTPSRTDSLNTKARIDSLHSELKEGTPFAMLAGRHSDSQTVVNRGEMPFLELSSFPQRIRNELEKLQIDEYTVPLQVQDGWVMYQLIAKTRNLVKLRELFISHRPSSSTRELLYNDIVRIRELATEIGLKRGAYEFELEMHTSDIVTPNDPYIELLGKSDSIVNRAVNTDAGTLLEPVFHNMLQAYVLIRVKESRSLSYKPLQQVSDQIRQQLHRQRQQELAGRKAHDFQKNYRYNRIIEQAEKEGFTLFHFDTFDIDRAAESTELKDLGDKEIAQLLRAMFLPGRNRYVSVPVEGESGYYIGIVHSLNRAELRDLTSIDRSEIRDKLLVERGEELFRQWLQDKRRNARIRDWRHRLR